MRLRTGVRRAVLATMAGVIMCLPAVAKQLHKRSYMHPKTYSGAFAKINACDAFLGLGIRTGTYRVEDVLDALGDRSFREIGPCAVLETLLDNLGFEDPATPWARH